MLKKHTLENKTKLITFSSDEKSFMVTATLVVSNKQALLIGAKFTKNDGQEIVDYLQSEKIQLEKVFIPHGDPDYYFGTEVIKKAYPEAVVLATKPTITHILESLEGKLGTWQETLGDQAPINVVIPKVLEEDVINFQGSIWEIVKSVDERVNLWNADTKTLIGGIDTFNEIHLFLADQKTIVQQKEWIQRIDELVALNPEYVIPSHADIEKSFNQSALIFTKDYLHKSIDILETHPNAEVFQSEMMAAYPNLKNTGVLGLSSKVVTNEIPWG